MNMITTAGNFHDDNRELRCLRCGHFEREGKCGGEIGRDDPSNQRKIKNAGHHAGQRRVSHTGEFLAAMPAVGVKQKSRRS